MQPVPLSPAPPSFLGEHGDAVVRPPVRSRLRHLQRVLPVDSHRRRPWTHPVSVDSVWQFSEPLLVHEESERLFPELPLPDILVAVEIRSEVPHRIVQVKRADSPEAHRLVDGPEERLVAVPGSEVVARRERMAGVDADPEAVRMGGTFHHVGELLEPVSDDGPRTRRVLQDRKYVRGARMLETPIQTPRDRLDRVRLALPHVGSRMEYHVPDPEELSPVELLHERLATVLEGVLVRPGVVDQVVPMDDRTRNPVGGHRLLERLRLLRGNRLRPAEHARTPGENLDRVGPDRLPALRS